MAAQADQAAAVAAMMDQAQAQVDQTHQGKETQAATASEIQQAAAAERTQQVAQLRIPAQAATAVKELQISQHGDQQHQQDKM
jgi:hypothetical protein